MATRKTPDFSCLDDETRAWLKTELEALRLSVSGVGQ